MLQKVQAVETDCFHCGLSIAAGENYVAELDGSLQHFCCPACRAVATTIIDSGLGSYYQFRNEADQAADKDLIDESFLAFDDEQFQQRYVQFDQQGQASVQLLVGGMHCAACSWLLEKYLLQLPGVERVSVSLSEQTATVRWQADRLKLSAICHAIASLGYKPEPYSRDHLRELQQREHHSALRRLGVAGIGMMQVGMFAIALYAGAWQEMALQYRELMRWVSFLVATPVVLYAAQPFFIAAWRGIKLRSPGMDVPVALAIGLAYLASVKATLTGAGEIYFDSVTMFTFLLLTGRYLEMRARHFSGRLSDDLGSLLPATATVLSAGEWQSLPLFKVIVGDELLVRPGQIIPVDGEVLSGSSFVDESQMTGEFKLQNKAPGNQLLAGSLNQSGTVTMRVQAVGQDLKLQQVNQLLQRAQQEKPALAQLVDKLATVFVVAVLLFAAFTYAYWQFVEGSDTAFWIMLSVLVVSCPCALSLATPTAVTAATSFMRRRGLLVTRAEAWEKLATVTDVVCDKTGTLTEGKLRIVDIVPLSETGDSPLINGDKALMIAAALEQYSEHPIARAFQLSAEQKQSDATCRASDIEIIHGAGLHGVVEGEAFALGCPDFANGFHRGIAIAPPQDADQWILLSNRRQALCWFQLQDTLREDAADFVRAMQASGLKTHLLTGDSSAVAIDIAQQLAMDHCITGASPERKLQYVQGLQQHGDKVLMLGDGVNDVPVLAAADLSVAMVNASNLAKAQADVILLSGQLRGIADLFHVATSTRSIIRQNISWALAYNLCAIPLAMAGWVVPYLAAVGMSLSSLLVMMNSLRLQSSASKVEASRRYGDDTVAARQLSASPAEVIRG